MTTRWVVVCEDYTSKPVDSFEKAERVLKDIESLKPSQGGCRLPHRIEEVDVPTKSRKKTGT